MLMGGSSHTPWDFPLLALLAVVALLFLAGATMGGRWPQAAATMLRRGGLVLAIAAFLVVHLVTPTTNGIVGAGRLLTLWPALALDVILFAVWSWRAGRF